jgi:hypothetical protein
VCGVIHGYAVLGISLLQFERTQNQLVAVTDCCLQAKRTSCMGTEIKFLVDIHR